MVTIEDWICLFIIMAGIVALAVLATICEAAYSWWREL